MAYRESPQGPPRRGEGGALREARGRGLPLQPAIAARTAAMSGALPLAWLQ